MENFSTLIKNQYLKHPPSRLSVTYGLGTLLAIAVLLLGFRYQLDIVEANLVLVHTGVLYPDSGSSANVHKSVVTNNGPATATNVTVKHYSSGSTLITQSIPKSGPVAGVFSGGVVTWSSVSIPPGQSVTFESYFGNQRSGNQCGELTGEIVSLDQTDPDLSNNKMSIAICPKPPSYDCPAISQGPSVIIVNSQCGVNCVISGGSISAPTNACPTGYTLQYQVDGGTWTTTTPS